MSYLMKSSTLPESDGEAVVRCFVAGHTLSETIKELGVARKTVQRHHALLVERYRMIFDLDHAPLMHLIEHLRDRSSLFDRMKRYKSFASDAVETRYAQISCLVLHHQELIRDQQLRINPTIDPDTLEEQVLSASSSVVCQMIRRTGPLNEAPDPKKCEETLEWYVSLLGDLFKTANPELSDMDPRQQFATGLAAVLDWLLVDGVGFDQSKSFHNRRKAIYRGIRQAFGIEARLEDLLTPAFAPEKDRRRLREEQAAVKEAFESIDKEEEKKINEIWSALAEHWNLHPVSDNAELRAYFVNRVKELRLERGISTPIEDQVNDLFNRRLEFQAWLLKSREDDGQLRLF